MSNFVNKLNKTHEQDAILSGARNRASMAIEALAGTGKTTTLKMIAEAHGNLSGQYVAFNRAIVDDVRGKLPRNVAVNTAHSLACRAAGSHIRKRLDYPRIRSFELAKLLNLNPIQFTERGIDYEYSPEQVAQLSNLALKAFVNSADSTLTEKHGLHGVVDFIKTKSVRLEIAQQVLRIAQKLWTDITNVNGQLPMDHDYYLKMWQLSGPKINADYILFDEAQDADKVMLDIVQSQANAQQIFCGDGFQQIYEWRGAENVLRNVQVESRMWLTQSFRFGPAIDAEANKLLAILDPKIQVEGLVAGDVVSPLSNPDAVLCRTNAGMVQNAINFQASGLSVALGGNIKELISFYAGCRDLQEKGKSMHPELTSFANWQDLLLWVEMYKHEAGAIVPLVNLAKIHSPRFLMKTLYDCVPEYEADVYVSTVHKAKGREWDSVQIYKDFMNVDDMDESEVRLAYVAVTRAKKHLDLTPWRTVAQGRVQYVDNGSLVHRPIPVMRSTKVLAA